jgi:hypothetical protein
MGDRRSDDERMGRNSGEWVWGRDGEKLLAHDSDEHSASFASMQNIDIETGESARCARHGARLRLV